MVAVPAAVVLLFWRRMKDASSGRWNADNLLWSCLGSLVVGIAGFVVVVILFVVSVLWVASPQLF
jgi:heme/copper-type cytochrome/quinol oxidase subunit 4